MVAEYIVRKEFHEPGYAKAELGERGQWGYLAPERKAALIADGSLEEWSEASGQWPGDEEEPAAEAPVGEPFVEWRPGEDPHPSPLPLGEGTHGAKDGKSRVKRGAKDSEVSDGSA